jgi:hypothetical protein
MLILKLLLFLFIFIYQPVHWIFAFSVLFINSIINFGLNYTIYNNFWLDSSDFILYTFGNLLLIIYVLYNQINRLVVYLNRFDNLFIYMCKYIYNLFIYIDNQLISNIQKLIINITNRLLNKIISYSMKNASLKANRNISYRPIITKSDQNASYQSTTKSEIILNKINKLNNKINYIKSKNQAIQNQAIQKQAIQNQAIQNQAIQNQAIQKQAIQNQAIQKQAIQNKIDKQDKPIIIDTIKPNINKYILNQIKHNNMIE